MARQGRILLAIVGIVTFLVSLFSTTALASQSFSATVTRIGDQLFLSNASNNMVRATSDSEEVNETLRRLANGDSIAGSAVFDSSGRWARIETIDFVGLRRLIGLWSALNTSSLMNFRNHSDLNVVLLRQREDGPGLVTAQRNFKYTLTPALRDEWVLFLSDTSETQMGLMELKDGQATITLLNPQTGEVSNVLELRRF